MSISLSKYKKEKPQVVSGLNLSFFKRSLTNKYRSFLYRELKTLLEAGLTVEQSFQVVCDQTGIKNTKAKLFLSQVIVGLKMGKSLHFSMDKTKLFSSFEINAIKIGEETNRLPKVFDELEVFFKNKEQLKNQLITVLTYPVFVIGVTIIVLTFMLKNVVPMFEKVFLQFDSELPKLTQKVIFLSKNFHVFGIIFLILIVFIILVHKKFKSTYRYRKVFSSVLLKVPFFGRLVRIIYLSRFCRMLSLLLGSKIPIVESLNLVKGVIRFYPIEQSIDAIKQNIIVGRNLGESLEKHTVYDTNLIAMIKVAEKANNLEEMFYYVSEQYSDEIDRKSKRIGVLMEPLIIIFVGALVGLIMVAMYLPMFDLSKVISPN